MNLEFLEFSETLVQEFLKNESGIFGIFENLGTGIFLKNEFGIFRNYIYIYIIKLTTKNHNLLCY